MKHLKKLAMIPCIGAVCLTAGAAQSGASAMGSVCVEHWPRGVGLVYGGSTVSSAVYGEGTIVTCPIAIDHDIGTTADFKIVFQDRSQDSNFKCHGEAYDSNGNSKGSTGDVTSSGSSGATQTRYMSLSGVDPASSWMFAIVCEVPNEQSMILAMRAY